MNEKMEQESSKEICKKRKLIVEPVFGQIKNGGFRGFSLRGHRMKNFLPLAPGQGKKNPNG
ncbi:hypothetical protein QUF75_03135 [Desulfococcaceae bacterium HSG7]|nr:hypothetical protein [Desulfococcaceae bacterium HSG7]